MAYSRWYDKNPDLKEVFEFIENLDEESKISIAQEILQILVSDFGLDMDSKINKISAEYNYDCNRWYDYNIDLFTSFELIKDFGDVQQQEAINKIITTILFMYLERENDA